MQGSIAQQRHQQNEACQIGRPIERFQGPLGGVIQRGKSQYRKDHTDPDQIDFAQLQLFPGEQKNRHQAGNRDDLEKAERQIESCKLADNKDQHGQANPGIARQLSRMLG